MEKINVSSEVLIGRKTFHLRALRPSALFPSSYTHEQNRRFFPTSIFPDFSHKKLIERF